MRRLIFEICFVRQRLDQNCDKVNHKSKNLRHYELVRIYEPVTNTHLVGLVSVGGYLWCDRP
jgi:hypothetical protein